MPPNTSPIFTLNPVISGQTFVNADGANTKKLVATPGANGSRYDSISIINDDAGAYNVDFYTTTGGVDLYLGRVAVLAGAGVSVAHIEAMTSLSPILGYLALPSGTTLRASVTVAVTAAKTVTIVAMGGDF